MKTDDMLDYTEMDPIPKGQAGRMAREWREKEGHHYPLTPATVWSRICDGHDVPPADRRKWVAPVAYALEHVLCASFKCRDSLLEVAKAPELEEIRNNEDAGQPAQMAASA